MSPSLGASPAIPRRTAGRARCAGVAALAAFLGTACAGAGGAPAAPSIPSTAAWQAGVPRGALLSTEQLEQLVAPVALFPDELLALVLPAATQPARIVEAARFLETHGDDATATPPADWDPAVRGLLNHPEALGVLDADIEGTARLGEALYAQQDDVIEAVQRVRRQALAAGSLASDDWMAVGSLDEDVVIRSSSAQWIAVPRYDPQAISGPRAQPLSHYGPPRPVYWSASAPFPLGVASGDAPGFTLDWRDDAILWRPGRDATGVDVDPPRGDAASARGEIWAPPRPARLPPGGTAAGRATDRAGTTGSAGMTEPGLSRPSYGGSAPPIPSRPSAAPRPSIPGTSVGGGGRR